MKFWNSKEITVHFLIGAIFLTLPLTAPAAGLGYADARHLLGRTGFGATEAEVQTYAALSREAAVARLLRDPPSAVQTPAPSWAGEFIPFKRLKDLSEKEKKAFQRDQIEKGLELRGWWYREMLSTRSPLTERMTLFWHNHFVSSQQKVKSPVLMYQQNLLLRRHALGNFSELLHAIAKDPAMILYLDNASNRKSRPNENFAREVMELFTLGEGHYQEADIKEAARAFTGWSIDRDSGQFRFYRALHDGGEKTVLGRSGKFDGDAVLDILLDRPETAEFVVTKLWREFISPVPEAREVKRLAAVFRGSNYDIGKLMYALLTSDAFYAAPHRGVLIKSPVELLIGTLRTFEIQPADLRPLALAARNLGQDVFAPPNVKGWPGGESWINSHTLLGRKQLLERLFRAREMPRTPEEEKRVAGLPARQQAALNRLSQDIRFDAGQWLAQFPADPMSRRQQVTRLVLAATPHEPAAAGADDLAGLRALVLDPVYQLK
jgi:uncharacterized protein (DUF1800 family)